jgi:hypothetical protein
MRTASISLLSCAPAKLTRHMEVGVSLLSSSSTNLRRVRARQGGRGWPAACPPHLGVCALQAETRSACLPACLGARACLHASGA